MKPAYLPIAALLFLGCQSSISERETVNKIPALHPRDSFAKTGTAYPDAAHFPTHWTQITKQHEHWVIFRPCDAEVRSIELKSENGDMYLIDQAGQETIQTKVVTQTSDPGKGKYAFATVFEQEPGDTTMYTFQYNDLLTQHGTWTIGYSKTTSLQLDFIPSIDTGMYVKVIQPCRECWGDECDDFGGK